MPSVSINDKYEHFNRELQATTDKVSMEFIGSGSEAAKERRKCASDCLQEFRIFVYACKNSNPIVEGGNLDSKFVRIEKILKKLSKRRRRVDNQGILDLKLVGIVVEKIIRNFR